MLVLLVYFTLYISYFNIYIIYYYNPYVTFELYTVNLILTYSIFFNLIISTLFILKSDLLPKYHILLIRLFSFTLLIFLFEVTYSTYLCISFFKTIFENNSYYYLLNSNKRIINSTFYTDEYTSCLFKKLIWSYDNKVLSVSKLNSDVRLLLANLDLYSTTIICYAALLFFL
jgi:hypothetical protein